MVDLVPKVVEWNRVFLKDLNSTLLDDPRVKVIKGDAIERIKQGDAQSYDTVILDLDNGPTGMVKATNISLYSHKDLRTVGKLLKHGGRATFWSAGEDPHFKALMETAGFWVGHIRAKVHAGSKRAAYVIYVADK
jgi:spermidine synthase